MATPHAVVMRREYGGFGVALRLHCSSIMKAIELSDLQNVLGGNAKAKLAKKAIKAAPGAWATTKAVGGKIYNGMQGAMNVGFTLYFAGSIGQGIWEGGKWIKNQFSGGSDKPDPSPPSPDPVEQ